MTEFEEFQDYFKQYAKLLGLNGYKLYFKYEPIEDSFARISINQGNMVATVRLNSRTLARNKPFEDIKGSAKHEALHLLCHRLESLATYRYATEQEIYEASEELVHKLEPLIE